MTRLFRLRRPRLCERAGMSALTIYVFREL